jgi:hypothetical protein
MGTSKVSSVAQRTADEGADSIELASEQASEQPRNFHFAVTWVALFAHLGPIQSTGPRTQPGNSSPTRALVPVVANPIVEQRQNQDFNTAWEMVVPRMIRTASRTFLPADGGEHSGKKPELL